MTNPFLTDNSIIGGSGASHQNDKLTARIWMNVTHMRTEMKNKGDKA